MKKDSFFVQMGILIPVLFTVVSLVGCLESGNLGGKENQTLIEKADSIKNSKPDSALLIYNKIISKVKGLHIKGADSLLLSEAYAGLSSVYLMKGNVRDAIQHDSIAKIIAVKYGDARVLAKVYMCSGAISFRVGEYAKAMELYAKAMENAKTSDDSVMVGRLLSNEAMILYSTGDVSEGGDRFRKSLQIGQRIRSEILIANGYLNLAIVLNKQSQTDSVPSYLSEAIVHFKKKNDKVGESLCYRTLGSFYYNNSDYINAINNFQLALNLAIEIGEKPNIAKGYHNLSELYFRIGDLDQATALLDKSIKLKVELGDSLSLAKGYTATGNLHYSRSNNKEALNYYKKTLKIYQEKGIIDELGSAYSNVGNAFSDLGNRDSALFCYQKSIEYHNKIGYPLGVSNSYINLGDEYRVRNDFRTSEKYLLKALNSKMKLEDEEGIATVYKYLANLYLDQSKSLAGESKVAKLIEAESFGKKSFAMAKKIGIKPAMQDGAWVLSKIYESLGKYKDALYYSDQYNELSKDILDKSKIEALAFAEARWNVAKEQQEIENLKKIQRYNTEIIKQSEVEARQHKLIIWTLIALSLFIGVSVLAIAMYVKKRRDAVYQKQLVKITSLRLQNTRNSISPHFFFNVLGSITGLTSQPERLKAKLKSLTYLLRKVIENIDQIAVSLESELEAVKAYVDLYSERIPQPFEADYNIGDGTNLNRLVPAMIIQIPVENAIKHGLMPLEGEKRLTVSVTEIDGFLRVTISDNGIGLKASAGRSTGTGTGLKVLMQTIRLLNTKNQEKIEFQVLEQNAITPDSPGSIVEIKIPINFSFII